MPLIFDKHHKLRKRTIEIKDELICHSLAYEVFIRKHIKAGTKIPNRVLIKYFSCFEGNTDREKYIDDLVCKIIDRFKGNKYAFEGIFKREKHFFAIDPFEDDIKTEKVKKGKLKFRSGKKEYEDVAYSFKIMIELVLSSLTHRMTTRLEKMDTNEVIRLSYERMYGYMNEYFNEEHKKLYEKYNYKFGAIASYIALLLGFDVTGKNNPTNKELHQFSRNSLKRIEKKKL